MSAQPSVDKPARSLDRRSLVLGGLVGAVLVVCCVSIIAVVALGVILSRTAGPSAVQTPRPPTATLNVAPDGCTVVRSTVENEGPRSGLQWVIADESGRHLLERNALGETRYTYFVRGKYDVVLQAFHNGRYIDISPHVKIECR